MNPKTKRRKVRENSRRELANTGGYSPGGFLLFLCLVTLSCGVFTWLTVEVLDAVVAPPAK